MKDKILNRFRGQVGPMLDEELYADREAMKKELGARVQETFVDRPNVFKEGLRGHQQSRIVYIDRSKSACFSIYSQRTA